MNEQTLIQLVKKSVKQSGDRYYTMKKSDEGWEGLTFKQMHSNVMALASFLHNEGFNEDHKLALLADGSSNWVNAELGAIFAKLVVVPMSFKLLAHEVLFRLEHSESNIIALSKFTQKLGFSALKDYKNPIKILWLDDNKEEARQEAKEAGINLDNLIFIDEAVAKGKELLQNEEFEQTLNNVINSIMDEDLAIISYTSGSSGNPRGVMLSHKNLYNESIGTGKSFYSPLNQFKSFIMIPCDHIFGHVAGVFFGLTKGVTVYFVDTRQGQAGLIKNIPLNMADCKPDFILVVPALMNNFMKKIYTTIKARGKIAAKLFDKAVVAGVKMYGNGFNRVTWGVKFLNFFPWFFWGQLIFFPKIRKALSFKFAVGGGALFDIKTQEFFATIGVPLYQGYGLTECASGLSSNLQTVRCHKLGTSGRPFPFVDVKIVDEQGNSVKPNQIGEITVKSDTVMMGYYKNPIETAKTIINGFLHTGDMGSLDEDGFLSVVGRGKALLISKDGEKYSPESMEEAIIAVSESINQVLLYCEHKPYTTALVTLNAGLLATQIKQEKGSKITISEAIDLVTEKVFAYKQDDTYSFPREWQPNTYCLVHKSFDINSTFKIVRYKAFELYKDELDYMYTPEGSVPNNIRNQIVLRALLREAGIEVTD